MHAHARTSHKQAYARFLFDLVAVFVHMSMFIIELYIFFGTRFITFFLKIVMFQTCFLRVRIRGRKQSELRTHAASIIMYVDAKTILIFQPQTWKKIKSFHGRILSTIKLSAKIYL